MTMTIQERLEAFWSGERPDRIPYTIYDWEWQHTRDDPRWAELFRQGLGITWHFATHTSRRDGVEVINEDGTQDGQRLHRTRLRTPVGEVSEWFLDGWRQEFLLKTADDYRVMTWIAQHTQIEPNYENYLAQAREIGPYGVPLIHFGRTPLQTILVDYAGLEQFSFHLADFMPELRELYEALLQNFRRLVEITAGGPGRYVANLENFTAESLGPDRYREFLLPVYQECFPILQQSGKIVGTHYDGRTASCRDLIATAPMDLIESLTEPNEGDQTLPEARAAWPDKLFWCNIRVGDYQLPPKELHRKVLEMVEQAGPDGRRLAFEVSEHIPANWFDSMPVVLEALKETEKGY
jgi:hypothetical protein